MYDESFLCNAKPETARQAAAFQNSLRTRSGLPTSGGCLVRREGQARGSKRPLLHRLASKRNQVVGFAKSSRALSTRGPTLTAQFDARGSTLAPWTAEFNNPVISANVADASGVSTCLCVSRRSNCPIPRLRASMPRFSARELSRFSISILRPANARLGSDSANYWNVNSAGDGAGCAASRPAFSACSSAF